MTLAWSAGEWADGVRAIASLAWPLVIVFVIVLFRKQFADLITRSETVKTPLGEGTFRAPDSGSTEQLKRQLDAQTYADVEEGEEDAPDPSELPPESTATGRGDGVADEILRLATQDAGVAVLRLADELEARVRDLASAWGDMDSHTPDWHDLLDGLVERGVLPAGVASNVTLVDQVRNSVIHREAFWERDALAALDAGVDLLIALDGIPLQGYEVFRTDVTLYRDEACQVPWEDTSGVIVRQRKPQGRSGQLQGPFPTRRDYSPGDLVGWQWSFAEPILDFYWPDSNGAPQHHRSALFVGEPLRRPAL